MAWWPHAVHPHGVRGAFCCNYGNEFPTKKLINAPSTPTGETRIGNVVEQHRSAALMLHGTWLELLVKRMDDVDGWMDGSIH